MLLRLSSSCGSKTSVLCHRGIRTVLSSGITRHYASHKLSVASILSTDLYRSSILVRDKTSVTSRKSFCSQAGTKESFATVDANVSKDVLIFTYENSQLFRWMTIFGIVQCLFWANLAYFCYSSLSGLQEVFARSEQQQRSGWWTTVIQVQHKYKDRIAVACLAMGYVVLAFTVIYPLRTVARLTLLKGGKVVRLSTYTHFGQIRDYLVPLKDISCRHSRAARGPQVSMKLRGRWFYYMLDKREGVFHNAKLFDYVVGLNRFSK